MGPTLPSVIFSAGGDLTSYMLSGKHTDLEGLGFGWSSNFWLLQSNELTFGLESTRGMLCSVGL